MREGLGKNKRMNDDVYALRKRVMNIIYAAKRYADIPRIEVRITDKPTKSNHAGLAYLNSNCIFLPESTFGYSEAALTWVVLHEIVHAVTGFAHDESCRLMRAKHCPNQLTKWGVDMAHEYAAKYLPPSQQAIDEMYARMGEPFIEDYEQHIGEA